MFVGGVVLSVIGFVVTLTIVICDAVLTRKDGGYKESRPCILLRENFGYVITGSLLQIAFFVISFTETAEVPKHYVYIHATAVLMFAFATVAMWTNRIYVYVDHDYLLYIRSWGRRCYIEYGEILYYVEGTDRMKGMFKTRDSIYYTIGGERKQEILYEEFRKHEIWEHDWRDKPPSRWWKQKWW